MTIDMKHSILRYIAPVAGAAGLLFAGCTEEVDNAYTRFQYSMEMQASAEEIVLDEDTPDDVALTISWTPATDYGSDVTTTYKYEWYLQGSGLSAGSEYEDSGNFERTYTHEELYDIMVNRFGCLTSSWGTIQFTVTASFEGVDGQVLLDDQARVTVRIKTYGPKQFAADRVFVSGTAIGESQVELFPSEADPSLYVYNGLLSAGTFQFPVIYGDENNVIIPASGKDEAIASLGNSAASVAGSDEALYSWTVAEAGDYRLALNFETKTVSLTAVSDIMEVDRLFLAGSAAGGSEVEITQTLENASVYAWKGDLVAGQFTMPIEFGGERNLVMVPAEADDHGFIDGGANSLASVRTSAVSGRYWEISQAGSYRIVVNVDAATVTIYSEAADLKPKTVTYKRTQGTEIPDFTMEVTALYMWSSKTYNSGSRPVGGDFVLTPSLADPRLFVYKGSTLAAGENLKFIVTDVWNNEYAYGSSDAGGDFLLDVALGEKVTPIYGGQGNNRYSFFKIPENTNYVEVYIGGPETDENENALSKCWAFEGSYVLFDQR